MLAGGCKKHLLYIGLGPSIDFHRRIPCRVSTQLAVVAPGRTLPRQYLNENCTRTALYTRVSTQHKGQKTANQLLQLKECCQAQNWSIVREYEDHESDGKSERIAFQQMLRDSAARRFDILFFWSPGPTNKRGYLGHSQVLGIVGELWPPLAEPHGTVD